MCEICVKKLVALFALANINEMLTWMTWLLLSGLSLRALSNNTYGWVCSIFPWCYGWNWLLFAMGVDKKVTGDSKRVLTAMVVIVTMWRNDQSNTKTNMGSCVLKVSAGKCQFILYSRSICWIDPWLTLYLPLIDTWSTLHQHFGWRSIKT